MKTILILMFLISCKINNPNNRNFMVAYWTDDSKQVTAWCDSATNVTPFHVKMWVDGFMAEIKTDSNQIFIVSK